MEPFQVTPRRRKDQRSRKTCLSPAAHLGPPPAYSHEKKAPVMKELGLLALEGVADELQSPAQDKKAQSVDPERVEKYCGQSQGQRNHDHGDAEAMAGAVHGMRVAVGVLRDPMFGCAST